MELSGRIKERLENAFRKVYINPYTLRRISMVEISMVEEVKSKSQWFFYRFFSYDYAQ